MRRISVALVLGLLFVLGVGTAQGQAGNARRGFAFSAGLGESRAGISCDICLNDDKGVLSGYLRVAYALRPNLLIGLEGTGTRNEEDGIHERFLGVSVAGLLYPSAGGLFLKGGVGLLSFRADDGTDEFTGGALALHVGTGYEIGLSRGVALAPYLNLVATTGGDLDFNGSKVTGDASYTLLQAGIGVVIH